jgi:L-fuconolactonase
MTSHSPQSSRTFATVDAHIHLWQYDQVEYGWIDDSMQTLRRDFTASHLIDEMNAGDVETSIAVQARQSLDETHWLLSEARKEPRIAGVVGWAPIANESFREILEDLQEHPQLVGLRHIVQAEPRGFLESADFQRGIAQLQGTGLSYDLLIHAGQLAESIAFVDRNPNQIFVVDHCAKPAIAISELSSWAELIRELARRENVFCKVSGLITEADWNAWSLDRLRPYLDTVFDAFDTPRLMTGSDWPVLTLASSYNQWWETLRTYTESLSESEKAMIFGTTAIRAYRLQDTRSA